MIEQLLGVDGSILLWIQEHMRREWLTPIVIGITTLGNSGAVWIVLSWILVFFKKTRKTGIMCLCALLLSLLINNLLLKNLVARDRPFEVLTGLQALIPLPRDFSFPSGHSGASFACAWLMGRKLPKPLGIPAVVLAALIACSRLYLGVHYPTDVFAGILSGILISYLAEFLVEKIIAARKKFQVEDE